MVPHVCALRVPVKRSALLVTRVLSSCPSKQVSNKAEVVGRAGVYYVQSAESHVAYHEEARRDGGAAERQTDL